MILVDTNVVSEPLRPEPDPRVGEWLNRQNAETLYLSAITVSELLLGVALLPKGRRRNRLGQAVDEIVSELFAGRILSFDENAARHHAGLTAATRATGHSISLADGMIAATAKAHDYAVATRDVTPFSLAGVEVIDPWSS